MRFLEVIGGWVNRYFSNEEAIYLVVLLAAGFLILFMLGGVLAPVLTGLVLAFLLQGLVKRLVIWRVPETGAVYLTFLLFIGGLIGAALFVVPLVWRQLRALVEALPNVIGRLRDATRDLAGAFPELLTEDQITVWFDGAAGQLGNLSAAALEALVANVPSLVGVVIYLVLVPISVFFFLKDRRRILGWLASALPRKRPLINRVGVEMNQQLANYVRGKFIEILIVGFVTFVVFSLLGLNYAALLGVVVGGVGADPLCRRRGGHHSGGAGRPHAVRLVLGAGLDHAGLRRHSGLGRQCLGAAAVFGSRGPAPDHHHRRRVGIRRAVGRLGRVLRHTAGYPAESHPQRLATGAASGLRALRPCSPKPRLRAKKKSTMIV